MTRPSVTAKAASTATAPPVITVRAAAPMNVAQLAEGIKAGLIAQGRQVPAAYAEHLPVLVDQGD